MLPTLTRYSRTLEGRYLDPAAALGRRPVYFLSGGRKMAAAAFGFHAKEMVTEIRSLRTTRAKKDFVACLSSTTTTPF